MNENNSSNHLFVMCTLSNILIKSEMMPQSMRLSFNKAHRLLLEWQLEVVFPNHIHPNTWAEMVKLLPRYQLIYLKPYSGICKN